MRRSPARAKARAACAIIPEASLEAFVYGRYDKHADM
jgi:hypothetical protein